MCVSYTGRIENDRGNDYYDRRIGQILRSRGWPVRPHCEPVFSDPLIWNSVRESFPYLLGALSCAIAIRTLHAVRSMHRVVQPAPAATECASTSMLAQ